MVVVFAVCRGGLASHKVWGWDDLIRFCRGKAHSSPRCWQWNKVGAVRTKKGQPFPSLSTLDHGLLALPPASRKHAHIWNLQYRRGLSELGVRKYTQYIYDFGPQLDGRQCCYISVTLCNIDSPSQQLQGTRQHSEAIKKTLRYCRRLHFALRGGQLSGVSSILEQGSGRQCRQMTDRFWEQLASLPQYYSISVPWVSPRK